MSCTEDDTFRQLKQTDYFILKDIIDRMDRSHFETLLESNEVRDRFLTSHGWNFEDFRRCTGEIYD